MTARNHIPRMAFIFITKKHIRILENVFPILVRYSRNLWKYIVCVCVGARTRFRISIATLAQSLSHRSM